MKRKLFYTILLFFVILVALNCRVYARITTSDPTVNSGENATITISSQEGVASGAINVLSDGGLTLVSTSGGTQKGTLVAFAKSENKKSGIVTYVFKTPEVTETKKYQVEFQSQDMADVDGNSIEGTKATATVTVKAKDSSTTNKIDDTSTTKSSKADLSSLGIRLSKADAKKLGVKESNYDFTGFKSSVTEYNTKPIPNDIDSLQVLYTTVDKKAKVKVTGNTNLEVGTNTIKVEVTAADGKTTKTYTIAVTKLATEDSKPGNLIDDKDSKNLYLSSLSIEGLELSPEFSKDVFAYEATIDMDENDLSKVNVNAQAENANATIEIIGNTDLQEGENVINVIVKSNDSSEQTVYQITVNKISKSSEIANSKKHINKEHIIIGTFIAIVLIILIILIINHFRNKKYEEENDYTEEDDENKNYNDEYNNRYEELNQNDNFIEDLYKRRNNGETLNHTEQETIEDIENETDRIFNKPKQGETFEYEEKENTFEDDFKPRNKGKHF